jgi:hypothetical protein
MKVEFKFTDRDIKNILDLVQKQRFHPFSQKRREVNLSKIFPSYSREKVWWTMVMCLLTSQQRSSSGSPINKFLSTKPFLLSLKKLEEATNIETFARQEIKYVGGIRFVPRIAEFVRVNLDSLNSGEWEKLERHFQILLGQRKQNPRPEHYLAEREAARYMNETFKGFGPKQSRNFWQDLGLTRYEFVLDSRFGKWLKQMGFPIPISPNSLSDEDYYCFLSDILRDLCIRADVLPCILDAAVFSSYEAQ